MISHDRYSKRSTHGNDSSTDQSDLKTAEGVFMGALAGALTWLLAFIVIGAIAVGW